ncbi:hypothetical protein Mapa_000475 [Marchantia paleacea]|nr:hypothetical protein Mapa_000475 [Marchantia paleacea]
MYQYSLPWFVSLYINSILSSEKCPDLEKRLDIIQVHFLYSLYCNVCRSLFEKDKLLFSCLLTSRILEMKKEITSQEWMFLLTGGMASGDDPPNPAKDWLLDKSWGELNRLGKIDVFNGIAKHFMCNTKDWRELFEALEPHKFKLPGPFAERLTPFQKLLVYRCIRPDKVVPAIQDFVSLKLGPQFVIPPSFNLDACYRDSSATCPLIFVLSAGSDPTAALLSYAAEKEMADKVAPISLGQGQGPKATVMINDASVAGSWVLLQNCHLAPSWMPSLERICEHFSPDTVHPDFRLWMTSYPSPKFPIAVLQNGVKMTNEPPKGLRANMKRSYGLDPLSNEDFFESCKKGGVFKSFLFGLAYFHGVVQERRTFGPLGWNIPYGFDDGDLRISVRQLHMFVNESAEGVLPLDALQYVTGECNYGGRVTDDKDRLLLNTILKNVYCQEMTQVGYRLSESGIYATPPEGDLKSYLEVIESYPLITLPEAFGLHSNADITKDMNGTTLILSSLLLTSADAVSTGGGGAGGGGAGEGVAAVVKDILKSLPPNFDIEASELKYPVLYEESMNTVLSQEMTRFNKLLDRIRTSLLSMEKAIAGLILMSAELEIAYRSIAVNQVPVMWAKVSYPSMKPLSSYIKDLYERVAVLKNWFDNGRPAVSWVSGFFFAQSFMTAALQNYARKKKLAIDGIAFDFTMMDHDPKKAAEEGVYIKGLYLEGCAWDLSAKILCESKPKVIYVTAPTVWLRPVAIVDIPPSKTYNCPVYRTAERRGVLATTGHSTNFLMSIRMPTSKPPSHWTKRGVAMLCSLSD